MIRYDTTKPISRKRNSVKCASARAQPVISNERRYRLVNCDKKKVMNVCRETAWPMMQWVSIIFARVPLTLWFLLLSTICILPAHSGRSVNYLSLFVCAHHLPFRMSQSVWRGEKKTQTLLRIGSCCVSRILTDQLRKHKTLVYAPLIYRYFTCILRNDFNHFVWLPFMCVDQKDHAATLLLKRCMLFGLFNEPSTICLVAISLISFNASHRWHLSNTASLMWQCLNVVEDTKKFNYLRFTPSNARSFHCSLRADFGVSVLLLLRPRVPFLWQSVDIFYLDTNLYRIQYFEGFFTFQYECRLLTLCFISFDVYVTSTLFFVGRIVRKSSKARI